MAQPPLPVFESVSEAYRTVWSLIGYLPTAAALPFLLSLLLTIPIVIQPDGQGLGQISWLFEAVPYTLFAVAWHRLVLLGPQIAPPRVAFNWAPRHWRFLGYALLLTAGGVVVMVTVFSLAGPGQAASGAGPLAALGLMIAFGYLAIRLCLVLPAAALDENYRLQHAWAHTQGQGLRLMAIFVVAMIPVVFASLLVMGLVLGSSAAETVPTPGGGRALVAQLALGALGYVGSAVSTTIFAQAFHRLAGWYPGDQHKS